LGAGEVGYKEVDVMVVKIQRKALAKIIRNITGCEPEKAMETVMVLREKQDAMGLKIVNDIPKGGK